MLGYCSSPPPASSGCPEAQQTFNSFLRRRLRGLCTLQAAGSAASLKCYCRFMNSRPWTALAAAFTTLIAGATAQADQDGLAITIGRPGPLLNFEWPALEIGVATYEAGPTGVTVIRFPKRAAAAVDVRGAGSGTMMPHSMRLSYSYPWPDAVGLSGGCSSCPDAVAGV